jgi:hypothetical protein
MTTDGKEDLLLNTRSFLSFQISQAISVNCRTQAFRRGGGGLRNGQPIIQDFRPSLSQAVDEVWTRQPRSRGRPDAPGEAAFKEKVTSCLRGGAAELASRLMWPSTFG